jgi:GNAT superfamily N-acetyltransferase
MVRFAVVGTAKVPEGDLGELYELDVDPHHWGTGAGRALLAAAHGELARLGHREAVLWVLPGNDWARRFYEVAGGTHDGVRRTSDVRGVVVPAVLYRLRLQQPPSKP